jgi:hypothetical protein
MKKYASFQIDTNRLGRLDQVAKQMNITRSQLLRDLIDKLLADLRPENKATEVAN